MRLPSTYSVFMVAILASPLSSQLYSVSVIQLPFFALTIEPLPLHIITESYPFDVISLQSPLVFILALFPLENILAPLPTVAMLSQFPFDNTLTFAPLNAILEKFPFVTIVAFGSPLDMFEQKPEEDMFLIFVVMWSQM